MSNRNHDREGAGVLGKLAAWVVVILVTAWAARNPHQAVAVVHAIAAAIAAAANHGKSSH